MACSILALQLFCTGQFSLTGVSSVWCWQAQKQVSHFSSGHWLQISSACVKVCLLCTTTRCCFTKWALSVKLVPHVVYPESAASLQTMFGRTNLPKEIESLWKKLEAQSKTWLLTKFLPSFPREPKSFHLPNVVGHLVGNICLFVIDVSKIQPY